MRTHHVVRRAWIGLLRWWRDTAALDRRLNTAKHDPARHMDADYEKLRDDGRINPF